MVVTSLCCYAAQLALTQPPFGRSMEGRGAANVINRLIIALLKGNNAEMTKLLMSVFVFLIKVFAKFKQKFDKVKLQFAGV